MVSDDPEDALSEAESEADLLKVASDGGVRNLTDAVSERKHRKRVDTEAEQASKFWRDTFSTTIGRREMWGLLKAAQPDGDPFTPPFACGPNGFPQPEATWFRAGQYALGQLFLHRWEQFARDGVLAMLDEHDPRFVQAARKRARSPD